METNEVQYFGYELINGEFVFMIRSGEAIYVGDAPVAVIEHIRPEDLYAIHFLDERPKGRLNTWELSPGRKRVAESAERVCLAAGRSTCVSAAVMLASGLAGFVYPPAWGLLPPAAVATGIGSCVWLTSKVTGLIAKRVKYVEFHCSAVSGGANRAQRCAVEVEFLGRMPHKDFCKLTEFLDDNATALRSEAFKVAFA